MLTKKWCILVLLLNAALSSTHAFQGFIKGHNPSLNGGGGGVRRKSYSGFRGGTLCRSNIGLLSLSNIPDQTAKENHHFIQKNSGQSNHSDVNHNSNNSDRQKIYYQSYVETVKCENFMLNAAAKPKNSNGDYASSTTSSGTNDNQVVIHLGTRDQGPNLVAVTGETGSGKSLLVFKVFQLVLGEKVSPTIMRGSSFASGEVVLKLSEPHLTHTKNTMKALGLQNVIDSIVVKNGFGQLILRRSILQASTSTNGRFRSKCEINGNQVTLKALRSISKPLITIVDASAASSALSQTKSRMAIIDTGVPNSILSTVKLSKNKYREARKKLEDIEREIRNRVMPASFTSSDGEENIELLQHWISELDNFEERISTFQESVVSSRGAASLLKDDNIDDEFENYNSNFSNSNSNSGSSFIDIMKNFADCSWGKDETSGQDSSSIESSVYSNILDLRDGVKNLDSQLSSAQASCDALSSLSSSQSVAFALEESRRHLFDATTGFENNQALNTAAEQSHELLNQLEDALSKCSAFMSDNPSGLMTTIETMRGSVNISMEDIDFLIADWGSLARKHGVTPFLLPALHYSLRQELDGNVESQSLLPKAKEDERIAIVDFKKVCKDLSQARLEVCASLTKSVTSRLKDLGMEGSKFRAQLNESVYKCTDSPAYSDGSILGIDTVDFLLIHRNSDQESYENGSEKINGNKKKVNLDVIGSSGEKARLLLAIETDLAGSVGASCNSLSNSNNIVEAKENLSVNNLCPVSVVYDEIDAHVGGNAAVSVAKLLADQAHLRRDNSENLRRTQVISITHSPSLAAIADEHIVIQKLISGRGNDSVLVHSAKGLSRLQEIARMASGDLAVEESIKFAEALLRDGLKYKQSKVSSSTNK